MKHVIAIAAALGACVQAEHTELDDIAQSSETAPLTCEAVDTSSDPKHCGACGNVCASGLCYAGVCADDRAGHVFVIGHSYRDSSPALDRILANAALQSEKATVKVLVY